MTNEDVLNDMLRKTFPKVIFIHSINEVNKTQAIHFSEEWLNEEYEPQQKMGRWIPVSERLPEDFQRVLVTIVNYNEDMVVRVAEYYKWEGVKGTFHIKENHERWEVGEKGLLAWMPLPEPYKAESEDTE